MFMNIGFGNFINSRQILSISRFDSAPMKRLVQGAKEAGTAIDATQGRKTNGRRADGTGRRRKAVSRGWNM